MHPDEPSIAGELAVSRVRDLWPVSDQRDEPHLGETGSIVFADRRDVLNRQPAVPASDTTKVLATSPTLSQPIH
jgi:hypothetical protein